MVTIDRAGRGRRIARRTRRNAALRPRAGRNGRIDRTLFAAFAAGYVALLLWGVRMAGNGPAAANVRMPVIVALAYDNVMLATGRFIGEGPVLETLSRARSWLHAFLRPLLVIFAWNAVARTGLAAARRRWAPFAAAALYAVLVVADLLTEVRGLTLQPEWEYGVLRYSSAGPASGPPVMILGVTLALPIAAVIVLWKQ